MDDAEYVNLIIDKGIKAMLDDIIPKEVDVLWSTIQRISERNPKLFFDFIVDALKRGEQINKALAKQKLGFVKKQN